MASRTLAVLAGVMLLALGLQAATFLLMPAAPTRREVHVEVAEGTSLTALATRLARDGLVTSPRYFIALGRLLRADRSIHAGEYLLHTRMRPLEILGRLTAGAVIQFPVTFPEGMAAREIAAQLEAQQVMAADDFLAVVRDPVLIAELGVEADSLEGYLFPSTYFLTKQTTPEQLVRRMVAEFRATVDSIAWSPAARDWPLHDVVTLASIIEKETSKDDERPLVSAVFHNRLNKRMRLESDPTIIYALRDFDGNLRKTDMAIQSPYNTYLVRGLPPGPIANPGRAALQAAVAPAAVDYLYFVSKNDGSHVFSSTFREHQRAVSRYQTLHRRRLRPEQTQTAGSSG